MKIKKKNIIITAALLLTGVILLFVGTFCPFYSITGIPCPGCGMTRALYCLLRSDFAGAFSNNPLCFILPFILLLILFDCKPFKNKKINLIIICAIAFFALLSYAAKLINFFI